MPEMSRSAEVGSMGAQGLGVCTGPSVPTICDLQGWGGGR
jgi:hypothetical protein